MTGSGERDLDVLLATMEPVLHEGEWVFCSVMDEAPDGLRAVATVREAEGLTLVVERADADAHELSYDFVSAWITLTVHSSLDAVGLTAAVTERLTAAHISANVIAGRFHDHLFVPVDRADEALRLLR